MIFSLFIGCGGASTDDRVVITPEPPTPPAVEYVVRGVEGESTQLEVEACARGFSVRRFALLGGEGIVAAFRGGRRQIVERGRVIVVDSSAESGCVTYRVRAVPSVRPGLVDDGTLLARPEGAPPGAALSVTFDASAGRFVTPYEESGGRLSPRSSFLERSTTWARADQGTHEVHHVAGVEMRLVILPGAREVSSDDLTRHLTGALEAAVALGPDRYPARVLVAVAPSEVATGESPFAFGLARRGGGASVLFVLDRRATARDLARADWVSFHELSHFAFPAMPRSEAWLTEGWATYFQEVLRARAGLLTPREAWQRLHRGFGLGREAGTGRPLHQESKEMWENYAFKRVYWAGAAHALADDLDLRSSGDSLERALGTAFEGVSFDTWVSFDEYVERLERAGLESSAERARAARVERGFPDLTPTYEALGLRPRGAEIVFDEDARRVSSRSAIVSGDL